MKLALATVAATIFAGSAFAGGYTPPVTEPTPIAVAPVIDSVSADWTGFYAGAQYGAGSADLDYPGGGDDNDQDSYGVYGGYLYDLGKWVVGGELDYNKMDVDNFNKKGDMTRLRARAGYDMGKFMPYATLGVAHLSLDDMPNGDDLSENAFSYGIGADYMLTDRFVVGAEYSKQDFSADHDVDLDTDLVQVRAAFRF